LVSLPPRAEDSPAPINPLTIGFTFTMAWGIVEYERSWPVFKTLEFEGLEHEFKP
jgi:hypothetical protein